MDGYQATITLCAVTDVARRLVGLVDGVRSRAAKAGEVPNNDTSIARIAAARLLSLAFEVINEVKFGSRRVPGVQGHFASCIAKCSSAASNGQG